MLTAQDHESWRIKQRGTAVCCRQMGAKMVNGGPLSLLIDFVNGSVKRGAMPVLGLVNVHGARMYYECQTTRVNQMEDLSVGSQCIGNASEECTNENPHIFASQYCSTSSRFAIRRSSAIPIARARNTRNTCPPFQ
jgi:hypothetical protein